MQKAWLIGRSSGVEGRMNSRRGEKVERVGASKAGFARMDYDVL